MTTDASLVAGPDDEHDDGLDDGLDDGAPVRAVGDRALGGWLVVAGLVGLVAAVTLLVEKIRLIEDPSYVPSCSINPVLSCGSVMSTPQAELLGFPNPVIGIAAFPLLLVSGALLLARVDLPRWYWRGLQAGVLAGLGLVVWLAFQSIYRIDALCPYCVVVWAVVWPTAWYVTLRNLERGVLGERAATSRGVVALGTWHAPVLLAGYLVVAVAIGVHFWSYWSTLL